MMSDKSLKELGKAADILTKLIRSRRTGFDKVTKAKIEVARDILNHILAEKVMKNSKEAKT